MSFPYDTWFPDAEFDGSYGRTLADLRAIDPVPPPDGFSARWTRWRDEATTVHADPVALRSRTVDGRRVSVIEHSGVDGIRLRAWLVEPSSGAPRAAVVHGHGYGGRDAVDLARVPDDVAAIFPVARGLPSLNAGVGAPEPTDRHVLAGIAHPDTYVLGLCARDLWLAGDALTAVVGDVPLYYVGESFGGGIGALALPWDDRFVGATLIVPSFGQYDERLAVPCLGSGEVVRRHVAQHPEARRVLRWFDASSALGFARVPVRVEAALWDQFVPPQGQFGVANAAQTLDLAVLPAGHAEYPGSDAVTGDAVRGGRAHLERALRAAS
ncbi:acetylxylan esterase [Microbacterium sp. 3J1]|uniref:acetylxylan esterase n=1 Tax=Microbacterium sp. 3J1 TaxID=861269 RepID=UPI000AFA74EC|nr:acetylxylan esterase [Microbacterium sp. 3J1]